MSAILGIGAIVLATGGFAGGLMAGLFALREARATVVMGVWAGVTLVFLLLWLLGLLAELQRSESIDLQRLMHLPVRLGQIIVVNFLASHFTFSILLGVPGMIGLALGLGFSRGPGMWLLGPLALAMVFMITSWTYCLRGWLATMMSNPRRRRSVIMGITLCFILIVQGPNLYFNVIRKRDRNASQQPSSPEEKQLQRAKRRTAEQEALQTFLTVQKCLPPLWVSFGAHELANERPLPAVLGTMGCLALGALGLRRAYRSTVRFYLGESDRKNVERSPPPESAIKSDSPGQLPKDSARWFEHRIPGVPEQAAALALATFRSMIRAPEVKMALGTSFIVTVILGATFFARSAPTFSDELKPFVATGSMAFSLFLSVQFLANPFGFDRNGFRSIVLCPAQRRLLLLGKNLACLPVAAGFGILLLAASSWWMKLPPLTIGAAILQFVAMLLLAGMTGNVLSILIPYRIAAGSMKPTKMPATKKIAMVLFQMLFPVTLTPALLPPLAELAWRRMGMPGTVPVNLLLSAGLAALAALAYWWTLEPLGRLLQRRETRVLDVVTAEVE